MIRCIKKLVKACWAGRAWALHVVLSQDGSRIGCVLGSFGFDLVVHNIYESAQALQPTTVIRALKDDFNSVVSP